MNDQNRLRLVLVHYSFFLMHYYISFTPTLLHFGYLFVKLFKGHTSRPLKHRLSVEMHLLIRFIKETNSINEFAGQRRGLVVRAVDYGVGDPYCSNLGEVKKIFPQEKILMNIS